MPPLTAYRGAPAPRTATILEAGTPGPAARIGLRALSLVTRTDETAEFRRLHESDCFVMPNPWDAGADCLYAPGITSLDAVSAIVAAVAPKPVRLLIHTPYATVAQAAAHGVRRISVGGALAKTAWRGFLDAAREIAVDGTFAGLAGLPDVNGLFNRA